MQFNFDWDGFLSDEELDELEKLFENTDRKDFCRKCNTDELYTHAMTFKCSKCHEIILGGE